MTRLPWKLGKPGRALPDIVPQPIGSGIRFGAHGGDLQMRLKTDRAKSISFVDEGRGLLFFNGAFTVFRNERDTLMREPSRTV
jgi:hypothetical protein